MKGNQRLAALTAAILAVLLIESITTIWMPDRWTIAIFQSGALILAALWCIQPPRLNFILIPITATLAIGLLQLLGHSTVNPWATWNAVLDWLTCFAAFFVTRQICAYPAVRDAFLRALLFFGFAFSALALALYFATPEKVFGLFTPQFPAYYLGTFSNKDHYAAFIELILPLALFYALSDSRRFLAGAAMAAVLFASVIAGASRAGSFLVVVETFVILAIAIRRRLPAARKGLPTIALLFIVIAICTAAAGWNTLVERIQYADPYEDRRKMLVAALAMFQEKPITGFGLGTFEDAYPRYAVYDDGTTLSHPHNDWVEWAVTGGLPFFVTMATIAVMTARPAWRSIWGLGILAVLTHSLIDFPMQRPAIAFWLFALLGAVFARENADSARVPLQNTF